ncbi:MAG: hypothetical protein QMD88_00095 [Coprothermobacterota bacterium]|nr:hypothetical protein [Coprothermobacterota bacterium]
MSIGLKSNVKIKFKPKKRSHINEILPKYLVSLLGTDLPAISSKGGGMGLAMKKKKKITAETAGRYQKALQEGEKLNPQLFYRVWDKTAPMSLTFSPFREGRLT